MREKVVGNAVCQVRTSRACCCLNPCDCQKMRWREVNLNWTCISRHWQMCLLLMYLLIVISLDNLTQSYVYTERPSPLCCWSRVQFGGCSKEHRVGIAKSRGNISLFQFGLTFKYRHCMVDVIF